VGADKNDGSILQARPMTKYAEQVVGDRSHLVLMVDWVDSIKRGSTGSPLRYRVSSCDRLRWDCQCTNHGAGAHASGKSAKAVALA
jgi:hypothetical protein